MNRPIIGIVSSKEYIDKGIYKKCVYAVNEDYLNLIYKYNGIPIIIPYTIDFKYLKSILKQIDALMLIGGEDIDKDCFNGKRSKNQRDNFEIEIYKYFKNENKPILGICRGLQIINVAEGGTLKNIEKTKIEHCIGLDGWINYHNIKIEKNTKLFELISENIYPISSVHHQQIDKLGKQIIISASSVDNVIEAIEINNNSFIIAFQGHIEKCLDNFDKYNNVIKRFIEVARNGKK